MKLTVTPEEVDLLRVALTYLKDRSQSDVGATNDGRQSFRVNAKYVVRRIDALLAKIEDLVGPPPA